jgi:hypothetical protein
MRPVASDGGSGGATSLGVCCLQAEDKFQCFVDGPLL